MKKNEEKGRLLTFADSINRSIKIKINILNPVQKGDKKVSDKHIIYVGMIFAIMIAAVLFFSNFPQEFKIQTSQPIDMSNDVVDADYRPIPVWKTVDIRVLNLDTVDHKVAFEMSYHPNITIVYNGTCYLKPSTYKTYHDVSVREGTHAIKVVKDRTIARTNYVSFDGVKVFEIQITPETIDFCYIEDGPISLERIDPDA